MHPPADLLRQALLLAEARHARSQRLHPGASSLGRCRRQGAYGATDTPPDVAYQPEPKPAAWVGTWAHAGLLPLLAELLDGRHEVPLVWRPWPDLPALPGTADVVADGVLDLKVVSPYQLDAARRYGARPKDLLQVHGLADALADQRGEPTPWVAVLYVAAATSMVEQDHDGHLHVQAPDPALTAEASDWWADVATVATRSADPTELPRDEPGPGLSLACDSCRWLRQCWGPNAEPGSTAVVRHLGADAEAVAALLDDYAQGGQLVREGEALQALPKAALQGVAPGRYGSWTLSWGRGSSRPDTRAMQALLADLGVPVPYSRSAPSIGVRPAPVDPA